MVRVTQQLPYPPLSTQRPLGWLLGTRTFQEELRPLCQVVIKAQLPRRLGNIISGKRLSALTGQQGHWTQISLWGSCGGLYLGPREAQGTQPRTFPWGFGETEPSLGGSRGGGGRRNQVRTEPSLG